MNNQTFEETVASIIEAGSKVASAATRLSNAKATLGQRIAYAVSNMEGDIDEAIAKLRAELGKSDKEGAKRAASALNSARPLIPFALSVVGQDFDAIEWPTVSLANAVLRGAGLEPSTTSGDAWRESYEEACEHVAEPVALAWADANGKGQPPQTLVDKKIEAAYRESREATASGSPLTVEKIISWTASQSNGTRELLIEALRKQIKLCA